MQQLSYSDGRTLKDVLDTEAYAALETYTAGVGMPLMMLEQFKPGMIVSTLQVLEFQRMGFTPQGVDAFFNAQALTDGKSLGALETLDEQIGFLAAMGEGNESEVHYDVARRSRQYGQADGSDDRRLADW